jgi:hypothetical protein
LHVIVINSFSSSNLAALSFSFCSPTPSYRWAKIDAEDNAVDIRKTEDTEFGNFNHTMTIKNIDINHNGTYACIATAGDNYDMVKWKLIVRGIC